MLATLGGLLALPLGLTLLLLPLLAPELSRPRDSAWGAVVLLLGLDLVTSAERLTGAPMLGVLCGALLIGRLGLEVGQGRWRQLTEEERQRLGSQERWTSSFRQLGITSTGLVERVGAGIGTLTTGIGALKSGGDRATSAAGGQGGGAPSGSGGKRKGKRWVRPENPLAAPTADAGPAPEPFEGPGDSQPVPTAPTDAAPASPSALLPAPAGMDQVPEPTAVPDQATQAMTSPGLESRA